MTLTLEIPDEIVTLASSNGNDPSRSAMKLFVLEAYRLRSISDREAARLLGLETQFEFHALLAQRGLHINYAVQELEKDLVTLERLGV